MEYIIILGICILTIFTLKFAFGIKRKDLKEIKKIGYDQNLNEMTNIFPENKIVCEAVLEQLRNETVSIQVSEEEGNTLSYYSVISNRIMIANIKDTFTRIQTIAHECIHSTQNRRMLLFNFIFSNIYLGYFILILVLTMLKIITSPIIPLMILLILGIIYYTVRSYLETDAMTKAPYVAKQYMKESGLISDEQIEIIMENYMILNKLGIPMTNLQLIRSVIVKVIIYCVMVIVMLNI